MRIAILTAVLLGLPLATNITQAGQNVVVLVDDSGSMADPMRSGVRRIQAAKQALNVVLNKLPPDTQVGVLALNQGWIIPLQKIDPQQMTTRINRLRANGGTLLGENLKVAADELLKVREQQTYGDYRLLVVTDGEANDQELLDFVLPDILGRGLILDVIGVDMDSDHSLATKVHNYRRADDAESLETAIAESLAESDASDTDVVGGESDFEVIAALPPEVTMSIIDALTTAKNSPVGGTDFQPVKIENDPGFNPGAPSSPRIDSDGGGGIGLGALICLGIVFFGIATIGSMLKAARR